MRKGRRPCKRHRTLTSTVTENGDLNPYAVVVAPVSAGRIQKDDVLVDNFNNISNLQGTGGTIVDYTPSTKKTTLFAKLPQHLAQCPGGIGLTTAMTMLKSGWVIVTNQGVEPEEFEIRQLAIEKLIPGGGKGRVRLRPLGPGRYLFLGEFHEDTAQGAVIAE